MSRYLGIDYGTKRIGLAISDDLGLTARPLEVVPRRLLGPVLRRIQEEYELESAVVGLPTGLSGHEGESATGARDLAGEVEEILGIPVELVDERFTSRMADSALLESGMRRRDRKATVDKIAAAIILQTFLDARRHPGNSADDPDFQGT
ncbi:MAG TPA: Holliday junction resolvase RuvX [Acidimicrobiia bacterium]|nr:Holliday junction resolvase RuvX [Acidimicrobiia bacterium]